MPAHASLFGAKPFPRPGNCLIRGGTDVSRDLSHGSLKIVAETGRFVNIFLSLPGVEF